MTKNSLVCVLVLMMGNNVPEISATKKFKEKEKHPMFYSPSILPISELLRTHNLSFPDLEQVSKYHQMRQFLLK